MEEWEFKIEDEELWIEDKQSRFDDSILPYQHSPHIFLDALRRESLYFEDIVNV